MATIALENGIIIIDFDDGELSPDGTIPTEQRRDIIFSVESARHGARSLERLSVLTIATAIGTIDSGPTIEVFCVIHNHKPLVRWKLGRWVKQIILSPQRAVELAKETRNAAIEAEQQCKWLELLEPAVFVK